ncbi:MAG: CRISPR-associated endonuclease Cas2 [Deltaproteobacteria bacterium]|nr:CRISPR-associated endonuclease Cas2 [Deltaproteobacteria bacterium]
MGRKLYVIAYDVRDEQRLNKVREYLKNYSTGGQKSVYECFLTDGELQEVLKELARLIREDEDRVHVFRLEGRSKVHTLGIAHPPKDPSYFFIG